MAPRLFETHHVVCKCANTSQQFYRYQTSSDLNKRTIFSVELLSMVLKYLRRAMMFHTQNYRRLIHNSWPSTNFRTRCRCFVIITNRRVVWHLLRYTHFSTIQSFSCTHRLSWPQNKAPGHRPVPSNTTRVSPWAKLRALSMIATLPMQPRPRPCFHRAFRGQGTVCYARARVAARYSTTKLERLFATGSCRFSHTVLCVFPVLKLRSIWGYDLPRIFHRAGFFVVRGGLYNPYCTSLRALEKRIPLQNLIDLAFGRESDATTQRLQKRCNSWFVCSCAPRMLYFVIVMKTYGTEWCDKRRFIPYFTRTIDAASVRLQSWLCLVEYFIRATQCEHVVKAS